MLYYEKYIFEVLPKTDWIVSTADCISSDIKESMMLFWTLSTENKGFCHHYVKITH